MQQTVKELQGDTIVAIDGRIGQVDDVYFDDERWGVRYLVVDTGGWLPGKKVLISPASIDPEGSGADQLRLKLSREQVEKAPGAESDLPVSRQYEMAHARHFGHPYYWSGPLLWGTAGFPLSTLPTDSAAGERAAELERAAQERIEQSDSHLRSGAEIIGYGIEARDGSIGEVEDFVVEEGTWAIRDVVVDTNKWWPGGHVRVRPEHVERIDWDDRKMHLRLTRDEVKRGTASPRS
jgi:sporulation protein YlmC with PRC-barrel domain